jgi:hypothetical protein
MTQHEDEGAGRTGEEELSSAERGALEDAVAGEGSDADIADEPADGVNPADDDPDSGPEAEAADRENRLPGES